ncbi:MAG: hypothetical protein HYY20_03545 [Candidatus Tectomicrobia bacterium]|uniref:PilN domain-containing protein n=1 Tax=Tectimicrobiota bacterium TaxID=2528274 RepID=A0A932CMB9_UNCTE|nr:hypothetical protein [Candidatus Tectomicrobia bacterium]
MFTIKVYRRPKQKASWGSIRESGRQFLSSPLLRYGLTGTLVLADLVFLLLILPLSREKASYRARVNTLQSTLSQVKQQESKLRTQIAFISRQQKEGILWFEKLETLPRALPASLWLEAVGMDEGQAGGKPQTEAQGGPQLLIRGLSATDQGNNHIDLIGDFARALNEDSLFARDFEAVRFESITTSQGKGEATIFLLRSQVRPKRSKGA